jgi:phosphohistidine phosphatase SixA
MIALHLLRHAHAGDPARWTGDDDVRPLSERGRRQAEHLARLLARVDERPDLFITSPKTRAAETAEIVARELRAKVVVDRRLAGPLDMHTVADVLRAAGPAQRPCLVGHDPDFSDLLGELLGVASMPMRKGAIARVDLDGPDLAPGRGILRWLLPPELVPAK